MRRAYKKLVFAGLTSMLALPGIAAANADLEKQIANSNNWAMQAGDMYNQRYSKLCDPKSKEVMAFKNRCVVLFLGLQPRGQS